MNPPRRRRILSGMRPTGPLHLGHLIGVLRNWVELQDAYDCHFMVADWHALTSDYADSSRLARYSRETMLDWLGAGLDPARATIFVQSEVKQHAELALLLGMFAPLPWLERCPTFKDQQEQLREKDLNSYGFLGYPVLQTADIALYKGEVVPVGEDQLAHLELGRELIRRFHHLVGREIFPEPAPLLSTTPKLLGTDGRKMSKSYGNAISLSDSTETVLARSKEMVTDPARVRRSDPGHPEVCSVFSYHGVFNATETPQIAEDCRAAKLGCVDCKKRLAARIDETLSPIRERRRELEEKPGAVEEIMRDGAARARAVAETTMAEVREALHLPG